MSLATLTSRALVGLLAPEVRVEVHLANGLPAFATMGTNKPQTEVVVLGRNRQFSAVSRTNLTKIYKQMTLECKN